MMIYLLAIVLLISQGCITNSRPADYVCRCEFSCGGIDQMQNLPLDNPEEAYKCVEYAKDSCEKQNLEYGGAECKWIYSKEEFEKYMEEQRKGRDIK